MDKTINAEMMSYVLDGVKYTRDAWTSHPSLVLDVKNIDPKTKHPVGCIKQRVTVDFTGTMLKQMAQKAADSTIIRYQNGYAKKAEPTVYLINEDGSPKKEITIKVVDFFKGRVEADPRRQVEKAVDKAKTEKELLEYQALINERLKEVRSK